MRVKLVGTLLHVAHAKYLAALLYPAVDRKKQFAVIRKTTLHSRAFAIRSIKHYDESSCLDFPEAYRENNTTIVVRARGKSDRDSTWVRTKREGEKMTVENK